MQKILIGTGLAIGIGLCGGLAMALVGSPTTNTKWVLAGTTAVGERYFVDTSSLSTAGHYRSAWTKVYPKDSREFQYMTALVYFDCGPRTSASKSINVVSSANETTLQHTVPDPKLDFTPIAPGTAGDAQRKLVCG